MCRVFQTNGATYSLGEMLHDNIGEGGENLTGEIYKGKIKHVRTSGGGANKGKRRVLLSIAGIGDAFINWNTTPEAVPFPTGADIEVRMYQHEDRRWFVEQIVSINGEKVKSQASNNSRPSRNSRNRSNKKQSSGKKVISATKGTLSRLLKGRDGYMRKLYLYAMGGPNIDLEKLESRAESLAPFIEYVELAKKSHEHLRKRARFRWEVVEQQQRIQVTNRLGIDIRVRRKSLPYVVTNESSTVIKAGMGIIHLKTKTNAEIISVRETDEGTEFSTDQDLKIIEGWKLYDENLEIFEWSHNRTLRLISSVTLDGRELIIKDQNASQEWFNLVLDTDNIDANEISNLKIDGQVMDWELVPGSDIYGPLKDKNSGRQVISRVRSGDSIVVDILPTDDCLYDKHGIKHSWKDVTKTSNDVTLKVTLDPAAEKLLDEERDVNPLDVLFSPDNEYRELNVTGHDKDGNHVAGGKIRVFNKREKKEIEVKMTTIRIKSRDIERQTITVDRVPTNPDAILTLSPNAKYLERQRDMLLMLRDQPLAHHDRLLRLTEKGNQKQRDELWSEFELDEVDDWKVLTEEKYDGTLEQRQFVKRALSTPDFAILQGPPGSGKTTAIIELITQFALQKKRVLLCGSTQASIDNVLTRITSKSHLSRLISPLRIGRTQGIYDEAVHHLVLSEQIEQYIGLGLSEDEAKDLILRQSNLTCGTMQGILQHPWIGGETTSNSGRLLRDPQPEWDVLIIDEASKTTFQQFVVPAGFAKKWILVGDVCQLSPFLESAELMTNLDQMKDENGGQFTPSSQRACLIIHQLGKYLTNSKSGKDALQNGKPILFIEPSEVPSSFAAEINAQNNELLNPLQITLITSKKCVVDWDNCRSFAPRQISSESECNMFMLSSDIIMCGSDCYEQVADLLPPHAIVRNGRFEQAEVTNNRENYFGNKDCFSERHPMSSESLNHDWSHEITWRLNRSYELKNSNHEKMQTDYENQLISLLPKSQNVKKRIEEVRSIALPSVLECLQEGFASKGARELLPETTLTQGFAGKAKIHRFQKISYQHRMHPEISRFSRKEFYNDEALLDANTIAERNQKYPFGYETSIENQSRSVWLDVASTINSGINKKEISAVREMLIDFIEWARANPPSDDNEQRDDNQRWEVAILSPYQAQRRGLRDMVRSLTDMSFETRFDLTRIENPSPVMLVVNSSDRFQGQEADVVFLSLRNGSRIGFLDSPSRMNVAATRARELRVIVGNHEYFKKCPDPMLKQLALGHSSSIERPNKSKRRD